MRQHPPDRALRRMVAQLSVLGEDDIEAILNGLDGGRRKEVEALLLECRNGTHVFPHLIRPEARPPASFDPTRMSPWLVERLDPAGPGELTVHARQWVIACATRLFPMPETVSAGRPQSPGVMARLGTLFTASKGRA